MITNSQINRLLAIRKVELVLSKNFSDFSGKKHSITLNPLTRFLLKEKPELMKEIDKILEKI